MKMEVTGAKRTMHIRECKKDNSLLSFSFFPLLQLKVGFTGFDPTGRIILEVPPCLKRLLNWDALLVLFSCIESFFFQSISHRIIIFVDNTQHPRVLYALKHISFCHQPATAASDSAEKQCWFPESESILLEPSARCGAFAAVQNKTPPPHVDK